MCRFSFALLILFSLNVFAEEEGDDPNRFAPPIETGGLDLEALRPNDRGTLYYISAVDAFDQTVGKAGAELHADLKVWFDEVFNSPDNPQLRGRGKFIGVGVDRPLKIGTIRSLLRNLKTKIRPRDVVVYHFWGHGKFDPAAGQLHRYPGNNAFFPRSLVRKWLVETGANHVVTLGDACAVLPPVRPPRQLAKNVGNTFPVVERLFFGHSGISEMATSSPGETAVTHIFMQVWVDLLSQSDERKMDLNGDGMASWPEFEAISRRHTDEILRILREQAPEGNFLKTKVSQTPRCTSFSVPNIGGQIQASPAVDPLASAVVGDLQFEHNVPSQSGTGIKIHANVVLRNQRGRRCAVAAFFLGADGKMLRDADGLFSNKSGKVEVEQFVYPQQDSETIPVSLFIPYRQLDGVDFRVPGQKISVAVSVHDQDRVEIDSSDLKSFTFK